MKKLKEIIKTGLIGMGNGALRAWGYEITGPSPSPQRLH